MARAGENVVTIIPTGPARLVYDPQEIRFEGSETVTTIPDQGRSCGTRVRREISVVETESKVFATVVGG